jgi:hypothetical protein
VLLPHIAAKLRQLRSDIRIDAFGSTVLNRFRLGRLRGFRNLSYRGGFDGFAAFDHRAYDAFVYTSTFDGMPNVVLEAIAAGLPVIAPDVGGIREIIGDGESGLLLPSLTDDAEMAAAYAAAIVRMSDDGALRTRMVAAAMKRLVDRHSPAAFAEAARAIFDGREVAATGDTGQMPGRTQNQVLLHKGHRHRSKMMPVLSLQACGDTMRSGPMAADHTNAAAGTPEPAPPSSDVQALLERIAFLEEQIAELRRAAMVEKARLTPRRASRKATLRMIWGALAPAPAVRPAGGIVREQAYKLVKMRPLMRPIEHLIRRLRARP